MDLKLQIVCMVLKYFSRYALMLGTGLLQAKKCVPGHNTPL